MYGQIVTGENSLTTTAFVTTATFHVCTSMLLNISQNCMVKEIKHGVTEYRELKVIVRELCALKQGEAKDNRRSIRGLPSFHSHILEPDICRM